MSTIEEISKLYLFINKGENASSSQPPCEKWVDDTLFYWIILLPAFVIIVSLAMTKPRKQKLLECCHSRPGLVYPMDVLTRECRISYAAAFGATAFLVYQIIFEGRKAWDYIGPSQLSSLVSIVSMMIYGTCYFPIFACLAVDCIYGYGVGTLYVWTFVVKEVLETAQCDIAIEARILTIVRNLPHILCLLYLAVSFPIRFGLAIRARKNLIMACGDIKLMDTFTEIKESYQGIHVRQLLKRPPPPTPPPEGKKEKVKHLFWKFVRRVFYFRIQNFRYPARLLSVLLIGVFLLYMFAVELLGGFLPLFDLVLYYTAVQLEEVGYEPTPGEPEEIEEIRFFFFLLLDVISVAKTVLIVATALTLFMGLLNILHMLSSFRANLLNVYKGNNQHIPPMRTRSNASLLVGFIRYAGYQVGYIAWGFFLQLIVMFIVIIAIAAVCMVIKYGITDWIVALLAQYWPVLLIAIVIQVLQTLLAKFLFLQNRGGIFALDNRRFLFIFTYYMFFYNIFLGLVSCLLRIIKAIAIGTFMLPRLDNSTLPRRFQFFDPGFAAYVGYIHVECTQTHPVLLVFLRLLRANVIQARRLQAVKSSAKGDNPTLELGDFGSKTPAERRRQAALFNWYVAYTLINNPQIRLYRKGYIQNRSRMIKEGKFQKLSDMPMFAQDKTFDEVEFKPTDNGSARVESSRSKNYVDSTDM